jgi:hypothetical protein
MIEHERLSELQIKISARLYEAREAMKRLHGDKYEERITPYKELIAKVMIAFKEDEFEAMLRVSKSPELDGDGIAVMHYMAATIEMVLRDKSKSK